MTYTQEKIFAISALTLFFVGFAIMMFSWVYYDLIQGTGETTWIELIGHGLATVGFVMIVIEVSIAKKAY